MRFRQRIAGFVARRTGQQAIEGNVGDFRLIGVRTKHFIHPNVHHLNIELRPQARSEAALSESTQEIHQFPWLL